MENYELTLPAEKWLEVLANVSPVDLCNVVLTSRHMNTVASLPELWAGMKVNREKVRGNGLAEFYNINRFKKVKQIDFRGWGLSFEELEKLLKEIPGSPLENANFDQTNFGGVSDDLLASAVAHLHIANLCQTGLTTEQCISLFKSSIKSTTLANVDLGWVDLSGVPAELLASSISRLQDANLCQTDLTTKQCISLLKSSIKSTTLTNVNLEAIYLSEVPTELLANSVSRLQDVNLCGTDLRTDQCDALFQASMSSMTLANVNLEDINLSEVPTELLANSVSRLQDVNLCGTKLTSDQSDALLQASLSSTTLRNLNMEYVNLSGVPSELLASSISRLQDVNISLTHLTTDQCISLLKASLTSTTLTNVDLGWVNLSGVPAELLASSIRQLEDVNLCGTELTNDQCDALLKASLSSTTLRNLNMGCVNLSRVPVELLASSISRLQSINLCRAYLRTGQCDALLKASMSSKTLANVNLEDINLSEVPAELLANLVTRLQDVNLCGTFLTTDQCISVLKGSLSSTTLRNINMEQVNLNGIPSDLFRLASGTPKIKL